MDPCRSEIIFKTPQLAPLELRSTLVVALRVIAGDTEAVSFAANICRNNSERNR
jgi:hypothetical protein